MIVIRVYEFASPDYEAAVELRAMVLREPLGLVFDPDELALEHDQIHIGAFEESTGRIRGTLSLARLGNGQFKMRQVAVDPTHQGQGIGRALVHFAERFAREQGFTEIVLHARATAISFYESLAYAVFGDRFQEVGLDHRKMVKKVQ